MRMKVRLKLLIRKLQTVINVFEKKNIPLPKYSLHIFPSTPDLSKRLARWAIFIGRYAFKVRITAQMTFYAKY